MMIHAIGEMRMDVTLRRGNTVGIRGEILDIAGNAVSVEPIEAADRVTRVSTPRWATASRWRFVACVQAFDCMVFFLGGIAWLHALTQNTAGISWPLHGVVAVLGAATIYCVFQSFRLYEFALLIRGREAAIRALYAGVMSFGLFLPPLLIQRNIEDGQAAVACGLVATLFASLALLRLPVARVATALQQQGVVAHWIYIVADSDGSAASLAAELECSPESRVAGRWIMPDDNRPAEAALEGALQFLRINPVDIVILKLPLSRPDRLTDAASTLRCLPNKVLFAPSFANGDDFVRVQDPLNTPRSDELGNKALIELSDCPLAGWRWVMKDVQDRVMALMLLVFVSPAMLMIMIAIKLSDPGPVFFRQRRLGYGGNTFDIIKFRSMRYPKDGYKPASLQLTDRDDPRVSPIGRILRKTSLDELPQLLNVLRGDMWLIGPRPHSPYARAGGQIYGKAVRAYAARYRMKPGITGWAQVCGWRGPTETLEQLSKRLECDLYYIENWSPLFDVRILFRTLFCVFGHENAF
jgi:exopolysaccharide biosynthesis polyprenyl glycosylphosphotransferase